MKSGKYIILFSLSLVLISGCFLKPIRDRLDPNRPIEFENNIGLSTSVLSFHLCSEEPQPGFIEILDKNGEKNIFIDPDQVISNNDILTVSLETDHMGQTRINLMLSVEGGEKFYEFTSQHTNELLAIKLDNTILMSAIVAEPLRSNISISGFPKEEAIEIAKGITGN